MTIPKRNRLKKLLSLAVVSVAFLTCPSVALAEDWVNLRRDELPAGPILSRIDRDSIVRKGDIVWYWTSAVFLYKSGDEPYDFRHYISADCNAPVVRWRRAVVFNRKGFVTYSNNKGDKGELRNIQSFEGSFDRPAFYYVC